MAQNENGVMKRGRPPKPAEERLVPLTINVTPQLFDMLCQRARAEDMRLAAFVRSELADRFPNL